MERAVLAGLLLVTGVSVGIVLRGIAAGKRRLSTRDWLVTECKGLAVGMDFQRLETSAGMMLLPVQFEEESPALFSSDWRVIAIGSAYPIPYEAEVCPFSKTPQPAMNQLDRDGDGITDVWELKYGMDKYNPADAAEDMDGDGFGNFAEFVGNTDPRNPDLHPPYATQFRFVERKEQPFPLVFQGMTTLSDGSRIFQINDSIAGRTHFASIGEDLEGVVLQGFTASSEGVAARLLVLRGSDSIELVRGEISADPKSQALLINILDRSTTIATMGALLYLCNDEYMVLGVCCDTVAVRHQESGKVFNIVGWSDGEREVLPGGVL